MNLGLQGFTVPQAAACYVCLVYGSVTMVTDARVFLSPPGTFCRPFSVSFPCFVSPLSSSPLTYTKLSIQNELTRGCESKHQSLYL
ncbi:hypothetical protein VZT92_026861 [Zoarces viviparus]|uniref:Secreted protein n=1 Tax=Zoarces viviparus TaxID=48416 RepID=A0AAW1DT68_ZOAVI